MSTKVGISVGGVIIPRLKDGKEDLLQFPPIVGAFDGIKRIVDRVGAHNVYIITYGEPDILDKLTKWVDFHHFLEKTGVVSYRVVSFYRKISKIEFVDEINVDYFIDDNKYNLDLLTPRKDRILLWADEDRTHTCIAAPDWECAANLITEGKL